MNFLKFKTLAIALILAACNFQTLHAFEYELNSIVKHPTKNELYIGGEFKTIIVMDSEKGTLIKGIPTSFDVKKLTVASNGNILISNYQQLAIYNPETGTTTSFNGSGDIHTFNNSAYFLDVSSYYKKIKIYNVGDQTLYSEIELTNSPRMLSYSPITKQLYLFSDQIDIKNEKSLIVKEVVKSDGYNTYNGAYVSQQSDGKGQIYQIYDVAGKKIINQTELPYFMSSSFSKTISPVKNDLYVLYWDGFVKISNQKNCTPIETDLATYAYATGSTSNGSHFICSSMKDGFIYDTQSGVAKSFDLAIDYSDRAYTSDIFFDGELAYILTADYNVYKMDLSGNKKMSFNFAQNGTSGISYQVLYYNGYSQKTDQDKEVSAINSALKTKGLPGISLEGLSGYVLVTGFGDIASAKNFIAGMKDKTTYGFKINPVSK